MYDSLSVLRDNCSVTESGVSSSDSATNENPILAICSPYETSIE